MTLESIDEKVRLLYLAPRSLAPRGKLPPFGLT
jgi:hypothetical protein